MTDKTGFRYCRNLVRDQDPDRYLLAMLAPEKHRPALLAIYAFNVEISRIRESVSETMLGAIRFQWWRDFLETLYSGNRHSHMIASSLASAITDYGLTKEHFDQLIDARSADLDAPPPASLEALAAFAGGTAAPVIWLALEVLGERGAAARTVGWDLGVAAALNGLLRALPHHLSEGYCRLPQELMAEVGFNRDKLRDKQEVEKLKQIIRKISKHIDNNLKNVYLNKRDMARSARPVLLLADLTKIHQGRLSAVDFNPFDAKLAERPPFLAWRLVLRRLMSRR